VLPVPATTSANGAEWHVICAGKDVGPLSIAELIEKANAGKIAGDDLVRQCGGLWTVASTLGFLRREFELQKSRERSLEQLGRFNGLWLSKQALAIGGSLLLALVVVTAVWAMASRPTAVLPKDQSLPKEVPAQVFVDKMTDEERLLVKVGKRVQAAHVSKPLANIGRSFFVIPLASEDAREIFPEDKIKARVETRLRQQGFSIDPESPNRLVVHVMGIWQDRDRKTTMGTDVSINLRDMILAVRPNGTFALMDASIWSDAYTGAAGNLSVADQFRRGIDRALDRLIDEHLAANP
jgi:hypothetical protein